MNNGNGHSNGNDVAQVLPAATAEEALRQRLSRPQTVEALNTLLDHVDLLALLIQGLDGFLQRGDVIINNVAASVADVREALPRRDAQTVEQLTQLMQALPEFAQAAAQFQAITRSPAYAELMSTLGNPRTLESLTELLKHTELLAFSAGALDNFLQRGDAIVENVASSVQQVREDSAVSDAALTDLLPPLQQSLPSLIKSMPEIADSVPTFMDVAQRLKPLLQSEEVKALMASGVFAPHTVYIMGELADTMAESYDRARANPKRVGLLGLLGALGDADVQVGLGMLVDLAQHFGRKLQHPPSSKL